MQTKTRQGVNPRYIRKVKPRAYATHDSRCPVMLYNMYSEKRPKEMIKPDSPFFLSVNSHPKPNQELWYKNQAMGLNKIYTIMKEMKDHLDCPGEKIVPYR